MRGETFSTEVSWWLAVRADTGTLYIGITSNLYLRVMQHKEGTLEGFTAADGCKRLLYFEGWEDIRTAIARGKQLNISGRWRL